MDINPTLREIVGLDVHIQTHDNGIRRYVKSGGPRSEDSEDVDSWQKPVLTIQDLVPKEINRRTGFCDLRLMLSFVSVVCGGDLTTMTRTSSMLTWLVEWIICCEFVWGRTILRYKDFSKEYHCRAHTLRNVIKTKLGQIRAVRDRWPMYASFAEDAKFGDSQWNDCPVL